MSRTLVKICGLSTPETLEATIAAGADLAGFVFYEKSPRHLSLAVARDLSAQAAGRIKKVALTVNDDDDALTDIIAALAPDFLQLHGAEPPERVEAVKARFKLPIIKAIGVAGPEDLRAASAYGAADFLLFDAKPAPDAALPGGNGLPFDWRVLQGASHDRPWLLSGGLTPDNVAEAVRLTQASGVDVSSGVESSRGVKDVARIAAFVAAARRGAEDP